MDAWIGVGVGIRKVLGRRMAALAVGLLALAGAAEGQFQAPSDAELKMTVDAKAPGAACRCNPEEPGDQTGSTTRATGGSKNDSRFTAAQSISSSRPS